MQVLICSQTVEKFAQWIFYTLIEHSRLRFRCRNYVGQDPDTWQVVDIRHHKMAIPNGFPVVALILHNPKIAQYVKYNLCISSYIFTARDASSAY